MTLAHYRSNPVQNQFENIKNDDIIQDLNKLNSSKAVRNRNISMKILNKKKELFVRNTHGTGKNGQQKCNTRQVQREIIKMMYSNNLA